MDTDAQKVYTAETITDTPFPAQPDATTVTDTANAPTTNTPGSASSIPEQTFPVQVVAQELMSKAINTMNKKIIQAFEFAPSGAIQIGQFEPGVSGDAAGAGQATRGG